MAAHLEFSASKVGRIIGSIIGDLSIQVSFQLFVQIAMQRVRTTKLCAKWSSIFHRCGDYPVDRQTANTTRFAASLRAPSG